MLLLLLLISTGCDVNIPGCGKRSLPFFKKILPITAPVIPNNTSIDISTAPSSTNNASSSTSTKNEIKTQSKQQILDTTTEMLITKAKPTPTALVIPTPTPVDVEKIAYTTLENGKSTLWTMNTDGTDRTRLTPMGTNSWMPIWSPNGKELVFLSNMNDEKVNFYLYIKGKKDFVQLTSYEDLAIPSVKKLKPTFTWSPKSDEIAYIYNNQIWRLEIDTQEQETLTSLDSAYSVSAIEWAPHRDNKYLAYIIKEGTNFYTIKLLNPRLKDELKLADYNNPILDISWSSDAGQVAYIVNNMIYSGSAETSQPKSIIVNASPDLGPFLAYSPAESSTPRLLVLAKENADDAGYRVALIDQASKNDQDPGILKFLTSPGIDSAIWSPDGSKIAYVTDGDLWVMDSSNGANKTRIAATGIQSPSWSKK